VFYDGSEGPYNVELADVIAVDDSGASLVAYKTHKFSQTNLSFFLLHLLKSKTLVFMP
jgi:hypothetical protein